MHATSSHIETSRRLLTHLRNMVGHRDRAGLAGALLLAARTLLSIDSGWFVKIVQHRNVPMTLPMVHLVGDGLQMKSPPLDPAHTCRPLSEQPDYLKSFDGDTMCCIPVGPQHRHMVPIFRQGKPDALMEFDRASPLNADEYGLLDQLLGLFVEHMNLLEYAETDTLTGLLNRKTFDESLSKLLANAGEAARNLEGTHPHRRTHREGTPSWLAVIDIDHFKRVNDTFGHIIGDEVLILVAQLMRESFRFGDQLFRFGGEEFVVVLQPTAQDDVLTVLERFRHNMESHEFPIIGHVTASIGVTCVNGMDTPTELIGRADQALYWAKHHGRNRVESHEHLSEAGLIQVPTATKPAAELF